MSDVDAPAPTVEDDGVEWQLRAIGDALDMLTRPGVQDLVGDPWKHYDTIGALRLMHRRLRPRRATPATVLN